MITVDTFTGKQFMLAPMVRADQVDIRDIAHGLANVCQMPAGRKFYSAAEHSVILSRAVEPAFARWALLSESFAAYIGQTPDSMRRLLPGVEVMERRILMAVGSRFSLYPMPAPPREVREAAEELFMDEIVQVLGSGSTSASIKFLNPAMAERMFLRRWDQIKRDEVEN